MKTRQVIGIVVLVFAFVFWYLDLLPWPAAVLIGALALALAVP